MDQSHCSYTTQCCSQVARINYSRTYWKYLLHFCLTQLCLFPISSKTRFRWFQESSVYRDAPPFALDGVYISEPCPNHCGGHGDCISGVCFCDMGYTGNAPERWSANQKVVFCIDLYVLIFSRQWSRIVVSRLWPAPLS